MMTALQIGEEMFKAKTEPMSDVMGKVFLMCSMMDIKGLPVPEELAESFPYQVIAKRLEVAYDKKIADDFVVAVCSIQSKRVGIAVLYAAAIAALYRKLKRKVTLDDLVEVFPVGFPITDELEKIWKMQKIGGANSVDMKAAWERKIDV